MFWSRIPFIREGNARRSPERHAGRDQEIERWAVRIDVVAFADFDCDGDLELVARPHSADGRVAFRFDQAIAPLRECSERQKAQDQCGYSSIDDGSLVRHLSSYIRLKST